MGQGLGVAFIFVSPPSHSATGVSASRGVGKQHLQHLKISNWGFP